MGIMNVYQQQWAISVFRVVLFAIGLAMVSGGAGYLLGAGHRVLAAFVAFLFVVSMVGFGIGIVGPWPR